MANGGTGLTIARLILPLLVALAWLGTHRVGVMANVHGVALAASSGGAGLLAHRRGGGSRLRSCFVTSFTGDRMKRALLGLLCVVAFPSVADVITLTSG